MVMSFRNFLSLKHLMWHLEALWHKPPTNITQVNIFKYFLHSQTVSGSPKPVVFLRTQLCTLMAYKNLFQSSLALVVHSITQQLLGIALVCACWQLWQGGTFTQHKVNEERIVFPLRLGGAVSVVASVADLLLCLSVAWMHFKWSHAFILRSGFVFINSSLDLNWHCAVNMLSATLILLISFHI